MIFLQIEYRKRQQFSVEYHRHKITCKPEEINREWLSRRKEEDDIDVNKLLPSAFINIVAMQRVNTEMNVDRICGYPSYH